MFFRLFKFKPKRKYTLPYFCTPIVTHCNLNCRYCAHFSPLAQEKIYDVKVLEKHFIRVSEILNIQTIGIMGGEPLLHPNINEVLYMFRRIFKDSHLIIYTNGILLNNMEESFWQTCYANRIRIRLSKFPINIDFENVFRKAKEHHVSISYFSEKQNTYKTMYKLALDLNGYQDKNKAYETCWRNNGVCTFFEDGKFYRCATVGNIRHFNKYFNKNLIVTKKDYLDIYKIRNEKEIYNYFKNPIDFCKYCSISNEKQNLPFEISKKDINDWLL